MAIERFAQYNESITEVMFAFMRKFGREHSGFNFRVFLSGVSGFI